MNMDYKKTPYLGILFAAICFLATFFKLSFMLGSYGKCFGVFSQLFPLAGTLFAATPLALFFCSFSLLKWFTFGTITTLKIPTILATTTWFLTTTKTSNIVEVAKLLLFVLFPLSCMALFIMHPVAGLAPLYACYWLLPAVIYIAQTIKTVPTFFTALQITFIAHAAGSIIWLYSVPMTAAQWNSLISIVAVERISFALITTLFLKCFVPLQKKSVRWLKFITFLKGVAHGNFNV